MERGLRNGVSEEDQIWRAGKPARWLLQVAVYRWADMEQIPQLGQHYMHRGPHFMYPALYIRDWAANISVYRKMDLPTLLEEILSDLLRPFSSKYRASSTWSPLSRPIVVCGCSSHSTMGRWCWATADTPILAMKHHYVPLLVCKRSELQCKVVYIYILFHLHHLLVMI